MGRSSRSLKGYAYICIALQSPLPPPFFCMHHYFMHICVCVCVCVCACVCAVLCIGQCFCEEEADKRGAHDGGGDAKAKRRRRFDGHDNGGLLASMYTQLCAQGIAYGT